MRFLIFNLITLTATFSAFGSPVNIVATAHAEMLAKSGSNVKGFFDFRETPLGVQIGYSLSGLPKNKTFGVHIHEIGDCTSDDAKSAGGHFDQVAPTGGTSLDFPQKYIGDLPSIESDENGEASGRFFASGLGVVTGHTIKGRSIIIHDGPDDVNQKSAPRIACGLINPNISPTMVNRPN